MAFRDDNSNCRYLSMI